MKAEHIRPAAISDIEKLYCIAVAVGSHHEKNYFERCLTEQEGGKRIILVAEQDGVLAGYGQLIWSPLYPLFKRLDIPEIQDLNVIPAARRQGIGGRIINSCEQLARQAGKSEIGISVGLSADYGAAQRLYISNGYIPDGAGVCYDDIPARNGDLRPIDGMLTLKLIKILK